MFRLRCLTLGFSFAAFLALGGQAAADPIQITSGFLTVGGVQDLFSRGFLRAISFDFSTDEFQVAGSESDGPPQQVLAPSLAGTWTWTPTGGSTELVVLSSNLSVTATPGSAPSPFLLSGTLSVFDRLTGATLFSGTVFGSGTATWQFVTTPTGGSVVSGVTYEFADVAPVPEPATVLLLAAGLAGVAARCRRSSHRSSVCSLR